MKIIVDAFGGDNSPLEVIRGSAMAVEQFSVEVLLTGDEAKIKQVASQNGISLNGISIKHAPTVIPVEEEPKEILKGYADSSMAVGLKALAEGEGDAFVSAGSTGAVVVGSSLIVKRLKGVKRAAIATQIPTSTGSYLLIDSGANHECRPEMLAQFGVMGSEYMKHVRNVKNPRVGIINIGAEETKGLDLQIDANKLLKNAPVNFIGNVEARGLPLSECDVAVADGFTGNVVLKLTEGMGKMFSVELNGIFKRSIVSKLGAALVMGGIKNLKKKMDYTEYGGALLIGIAKPVIKAHGSSNAKAFMNAIRQAKECCAANVIDQIASSLAQLPSSKESEKEQQG